MRNIIHDYDGCLVNYIAGFTTYLVEVHGVVMPEHEQQTYDIAKWLGIEKERMNDLILLFNTNDQGYFEELHPMPGAVEAVSRFRDIGMRQEVLTACHDAEETVTGRLKNSHAAFGQFDDFNFVKLSESKDPHFELRPKSFLIEDNLKNAIMGARHGHRVFLMDSVYNQTTEELPVTRVRHWDEVADMICEFFEAYELQA